MEEIETDVTLESSPEIEQPVNDPESGDQETQQVDIPEQGQAQFDRPQQNYEAEWKRKHDELVKNLPNIVKEAVTEANQSQKQQEYKIEDLELFLRSDESDDPNSKRWAIQKLEELRDAKRKKEIQEYFENQTKAQREQSIREQTEKEVLNDSRFSEAFIKDASGKKIFNNASPLTQIAAQYMQQPELQSRPDGLAIAMKLAYADYAVQKTGQTQQQVETMKRQNAKLKQTAMVEGSGVQHQAPVKNVYSESIEQLRKTGSKTALRSAVKEIMKRQGITK